MKRLFWFAFGFSAVLLVLMAQQSDVIVKLTQGERPGLAVPDLRGTGGAQNFMAVFNQTLWDDLNASGLFRMVPKSMYPLQVPQQPSDFKPRPAPAPASKKRRQLPVPQSGGGLWLSDWASPPVSGHYLAFGYTAVQNDVLVLYGWLFNVTQADPAGAQVLGKRYLSSVDEAGARKVAREFAADIIGQFGGKSLLGTRIYFISNRSGQKEVWSMDPDGSSEKQVTDFRSLSIMPAVAPDGTRIAFTSYARGNPAIVIFSVNTGRRLPFYNQVASMNATPDFTPDGQGIVYSSTASGYSQIYIANSDGSNLRRISDVRAIEVEPKVNPKTGQEIIFVSGRSGPQQIYRMNMNGANVERLTSGEGYASNPAWHPDGQVMAFAWTRGYAPGRFNIFIMDVATRSFTQLTHGTGRNENPSWAPDGRHIAFMSDRSGRPQIYTMLADGTDVRQVTTKGSNWTPVWSRSTL